MVIFHNYVSLPEGSLHQLKLTQGYLKDIDFRSQLSQVLKNENLLGDYPTSRNWEVTTGGTWQLKASAHMARYDSS